MSAEFPGGPAPAVERRQLLRGAAAFGVVGLGGVSLTGCGGNGGSGGGGDQSVPDSLQGQAIAQTSDIPQGGGRVFGDQEVVVTQPSEGTFKAFSATCTHRGCTVGTVEESLIKCPCHGSQYDINDASVQAGPAPEPLTEYPTSVRDGQVVIGGQGDGNGGMGGY